jgi:hypothetical protein
LDTSTTSNNTKREVNTDQTVDILHEIITTHNITAQYQAPRVTYAVFAVFSRNWFTVFIAIIVTTY